MKAQYAILRFAKYKGPEIGHIESHNERTKEKYASNPDVDTSRSHLSGDATAQVPRRSGKADHRGGLPYTFGQRARGGGAGDGQPGIFQGQEEK